MALNVYIPKQCSSLLRLGMSLLHREDAGNSFIAEGVTQGWGAVEEQRKELCGMSASCCIPKFSARPYGRVYLHNWLNCFSPTRIHPFTDASCLLSGHVPTSPAGKLRVSVFRWQLLMPSASIPCPLRGSSTSGFSPVVHSVQVGGRSRSVRAPSPARDTARPTPCSMGTCRPFTELIFLMTSHMHVFISSSSIPMILWSLCWTLATAKNSEELQSLLRLPAHPTAAVVAVRRDGDRLGQINAAPSTPGPGLKPEPVQKVVKRPKPPCNPQSKL